MKKVNFYIFRFILILLFYYLLYFFLPDIYKTYNEFGEYYNKTNNEIMFLVKNQYQYKFFMFFSLFAVLYMFALNVLDFVLVFNMENKKRFYKLFIIISIFVLLLTFSFLYIFYNRYIYSWIYHYGYNAYCHACYKKDNLYKKQL